MTKKTAPLNKEKHQHLRVKPNPSFEQGKSAHMVNVSVKEFPSIANNFPIVLVKNPDTGEFRCVALLGFSEGENLFYAEGPWKSFYVPLALLREPFVIGRDENDPDPNRLCTCIEEDSPYLSKDEGEPLYLEDGSESNLLKEKKAILGELFDGEIQTQKFIKELIDLGLVAPFTLKMANSEGKARQIEGMYNLDEKKIQSLDKEKVVSLHGNGYLALMYLMINSMGQLYSLVKLKNEALDAPIVQFQVDFNAKQEAA